MLLKSLFINILAPLDIQLNKMKRIDGKASTYFRHNIRVINLIFFKIFSELQALGCRHVIPFLDYAMETARTLGDVVVCVFTVEQIKHKNR